MKHGTVVIGAGFAGLSVAAHLARGGRKVTLLEKHDFESVGAIEGGEFICLAEDFDPTSMLFEMGLPAVRISTRGSAGTGEEEVPGAGNRPR